MKKDWDSILFNDIGVKIQSVAKFSAYFGFLASFIGGIAMALVAFSDWEWYWYYIFLAPFVVLFGCVFAWLSVILLYGFGKLIEDVETIRNKETASLKQKEEHVPPVKESERVSIPIADTIAEPREEAELSDLEPFNIENAEFEDMFCPNCGEKISVMIGEENPSECPFCGLLIGEESASVVTYELRPIEKPAGFEGKAVWEKEIKEMETKEVYQRYKDEEEWSEAYRYLCYEELKRRSV